MSARSVTPGRRFTFDLEVEVAPGLAVSGGEMAELISDGLAALDNKRLLFPAANPPNAGGWLQATSIQCTGYERPASIEAVDAAYARLMAPARHKKAKGPAKLVEDLREAAEEIGAAILRLRMLQARLEGVAEILEQPTPPAEETAKAATIRIAATVILETVNKEMSAVP